MVVRVRVYIHLRWTNYTSPPHSSIEFYTIYWLTCREFKPHDHLFQVDNVNVNAKIKIVSFIAELLTVG